MSKRGEEFRIQAQVIGNPESRGSQSQTEKCQNRRLKQAGVRIVPNQGCNTQIHKPEVDSGPGHLR